MLEATKVNVTTDAAAGYEKYLRNPKRPTDPGRIIRHLKNLSVIDPNLRGRAFRNPNMPSACIKAQKYTMILIDQKSKVVGPVLCVLLARSVGQFDFLACFPLREQRENESTNTYRN